MNADSKRINTAQAALSSARTELDRAIEAACPGPHKPTQHRDRRAPWCRACRRTANGLEVTA